MHTTGSKVQDQVQYFKPEPYQQQPSDRNNKTLWQHLMDRPGNKIIHLRDKVGDKTQDIIDKLERSDAFRSKNSPQKPVVKLSSTPIITVPRPVDVNNGNRVSTNMINSASSPVPRYQRVPQAIPVTPSPSVGPTIFRPQMVPSIPGKKTLCYFPLSFITLLYLPFPRSPVKN